MNRAEEDGKIDAEELSRTPLPEDPSWRDLVVLPDTPLLGPAHVTVERDPAGAPDPERLLVEGGEPLVLRTAERHGTSVIVDLGLLAMGRLEVVVERIAGAPLRVAHAQFRDRLSPEGDGIAAFFGTDAAPWSRVDLFAPREGRATLVADGKRESRYLLLTLDGPGEAVIDHVRICSTVYPVARDGHFLSDDALVNLAWHGGAHTGDLASVSEDSDLPGAPEGPSPWMLTTPFDRVIFMGDLHMQALAGYRQSSDYGWLVRESLRRFGWIQNPDGSLPAAASHLVHGDPEHPDDPGPADGWRVPENGPDPDLALRRVGPDVSLFHDVSIHGFTVFWIASLADHHLHTGDTGFARAMLPVARRAIAFLESRTDADGLFREEEDRRTDPEAPLAMVANWSPLDLASGVDALTNAVLYDALRGLATLERDVADDVDTAHRLEERAERLRRALMDRLWDEETGAVILNSDDPSRDRTGDANAGALVFGILDPERARRVMRHLETTLATPYGTRSSEFEDNPYRASDIQGYIQALDALGRVRNGDVQGALDLIRRWWGHMVETGPGTGWFSWENDGTREPGAFASTPWTTPVPALSEGVLGVRPTAPGYRRWRVAPGLADLGWAQGRVPTPDGGLAVRWVRDREAGTFVLTVEPSGGAGEVLVPLAGERRRVAVDGVLRWDGDRPVNTSAERGSEPRLEGDGLLFPGVEGPHTFAWGP
ncbi:alpha-L-rhamnosidase C-terminal domain-containing protein [Nocardiopsis alba]|uniref:MGH1-like glycoside hydrolase domain-containing protein n=1 Tax=Nocardiopsis alba TaxID=53437 RepID=UPI003409F3F0